MTIDHEIVRELLRTLRNVETALKSLDAIEAASDNTAVRWSKLTLDTIRAREWLADALADDDARRSEMDATGWANGTSPVRGRPR